MLQFIQYRYSDDFFTSPGDYLDLKELMVVTPNPNKADQARSRFEASKSTADCVTISKFLQNQIERLLPDEALNNYKGKSELMLFLGAVWKKINPNPSFKHFTHAFNVFTELRSFTTESDVMDSLLDYYENDLADSIRIFQKIMQDMHVIDEHGAYNLLTQRLRAGDLPPDYKGEMNLVFYGFDAMTASQVDLLKALGLRSKISLLLSENVYTKISEMDWISWLRVEDHIHVRAKNGPKAQALLHYFPQNYLYQTLRERDDFDGVVLGCKSSHVDYIQELPFSRYHFKQGVELFDQAEAHFWRAHQLVNSSVEEFREDIKSYIKECTQDQNFLGVKVGTVVLGKLNHWAELSDVNQALSFFDFEILKNTSQLDLPRLNKTNLTSHKYIHDMSQIEGIKDQKIALIISSNYTKLNFAEGHYTDKMEKHLATIGPLKRAELEFLITLNKIKELVALNEVTIFLESGFLESDLYWKKILDELQLTPEDKKLDVFIKKSYPEKKRETFELKKISSSRLQVYSDCPQKFYYSYVDQLQPQIKLQGAIDVLELGIIQHKVIETYLSRFDSFVEQSYREIIWDCIQKYKKDGLNLEPVEVEVRAYTYTIIKHLLQLKHDKNLLFEFEKSFRVEKDLLKEGSIDCWAESTDYQMILDFKRSGSAFKSFDSILSFEKNQLWFYLQRLAEMGMLNCHKKIVFGYIDLSDTQNSMVFSGDKDILSYFKTQIGFKRVKELPDFETHLAEYLKFESDEIERLKKDSSFPPRPFNKSVCDFCFLNQVCERESLV